MQVSHKLHTSSSLFIEKHTVGAHLIEYTVERNELESDSSSTTAMAVRRTQNGGVVLRQIQ